MTDIPENVDLRWIARHLVELRRDVREIRDDVDKLEPWKVLIAGAAALGAWSAFPVFALAHWWRP